MNSDDVSAPDKLVDKIAQVNINSQVEQHIHLGGGKPSLPSNMPSTKGFIGREVNLKNLRRWYKTNKIRCFVLHGMGGTGKTELAIKFANEISDDYDAHIFIDLCGAGGNPLTTEDTMWQIISWFYPMAQRPRIPLSDPKSDKVFSKVEQTAMEMPILQAQYRELLNKHNILIILDNAKDDTQISAFNELNASCLIITSRQRLYLENCESQNVEEMSSKEAIKMLARKLGKTRFEGEIENIAKLCGYLPLALRAAEGVLFNQSTLSAKSYMKQLKSTRLKLFHPKRGITVESAFALSYNYLKVEQQNYLRRLAVFPTDFDITAVATVWNTDVELTEIALAELESYGLVKFNRKTKRYSLHDLMREFTGAKLSEEECFQTQFLFAKYYASILIRADEMQQTRERNYYTNALKLIDSDWNNITTGQKWTTEFINNNDRIADLCAHYSSYARDFITLRLHPRQNIKWLESGLKADQKLNNRQREGESLGNLGLAYNDLGEYRKAIDYLEQSLKISREISHRLGEGKSLGRLGATYFRLGEYQKAIDYNEQYLAISREIGDRLGEGGSLGNLGLAYSDLGEYQKAIDYLEKALAIKREVGDRLGQGNSLGNLGLAYNGLGEKEIACRLLKQALAILELIESPNANSVRKTIEENC